MGQKFKQILMTDDMDIETAEGKKRSFAVKSWAIALSEKLRRSLKLVHVEDLTLYPVTNPIYRRYIQDWMSERKSKLMQISKTLKVPVSVALLEGYPAQKLIELTAKKNDFELIVLGSHGRKGAERLFLGSVAEEVIRNSKIPVVTLGPNALESPTPLCQGSPLRILFATDLSENSRNAEAYALSLAEQLSAHIIFFHSFLGEFHPSFQPAFSPGGPLMDLWDTMQSLQTEATKKMNQKVKRFQQRKISCESRMDTNSTSSSTAILREIKQKKPDFVIMGTHARNLLSGAFFGNTARQIILSSPVPVMTVRSRKF